MELMEYNLQSLNILISKNNATNRISINTGNISKDLYRFGISLYGDRININ